MNTTTTPNNRILFRLPNWLGDVCMALPVIKAIQAKILRENPDAEFAFLLQPQYITLLDKLGIAGEKIALPKKNWRYFFRFFKWRGRFDHHILFTNSERGDVEAWLMGSKHRYGIARPNKNRRLLTRRYTLAPDFDEEALHQTFLWRDFAAHFGLLDELDLAPCYPTNAQDTTSIGLICGSANTPEKRWSSKNWKYLIRERLPHNISRVVLIGTDDDFAVCEQIANAVEDPRVENLAGKTNLAELTDLMRDLSLVVGNDTGGLHIANALGVPVIGLYGYTNPVRCHPIHDAPLVILQSPKGYGEGVMNDINTSMVASAITHIKS